MRRPAWQTQRPLLRPSLPMTLCSRTWRWMASRLKVSLIESKRGSIWEVYPKPLNPRPAVVASVCCEWPLRISKTLNPKPLNPKPSTLNPNPPPPHPRNGDPGGCQAPAPAPRRGEARRRRERGRGAVAGQALNPKT